MPWSSNWVINAEQQIESSWRDYRNTTLRVEEARLAEEINRSLVAINDGAQESFAGASQTESASHELSRLAADLQGIATRFRV